MKISIVTSVKDGAPYIRDAVASVRAQRHDDWEYLIIDAGSSDGTWPLLQEAAAEDARISCVQHEGEPLYRSLAWGLAECRGDYLSWLNADDFYPPWALSTVSSFVERVAAEWVSGLPACWDENGDLQFVRPRSWHPQWCIQKGAFNLAALGFLQQESIFFSRNLFSKLSAADRETFAAQNFAGDFFLWKTFARRAPLTPIPAVLGGFRAHGANMSSQNMEAYMDEVRVLGGWIPNKFIGALARQSYNVASALASLRAANKAEQSLLAEDGARS